MEVQSPWSCVFQDNTKGKNNEKLTNIEARRGVVSHGHGYDQHKKAGRRKGRRSDTMYRGKSSIPKDRNLVRITERIYLPLSPTIRSWTKHVISFFIFNLSMRIVLTTQKKTIRKEKHNISVNLKYIFKFFFSFFYHTSNIFSDTLPIAHGGILIIFQYF